MSTLPELVVAEAPGGPCASCGAANAKFQCSGCSNVSYCSEDHRADDWQKHENACKSYKILHNEEVGRYVVAARNLKAGEEIWSEKPFVVGPKASSYPLCLGCYSPWPPAGPESVDRPLCSKCQWPVCGPDCEALPCHKDYECKVFAAAGEKFNVSAAFEGDNGNGVPQLDCITPLRLLIVSERDAERWRVEVKNMETHNLKRAEQPAWKQNHVNIVEYLRSRCKLNSKFSEEDVHTACGILGVNSHEARTPLGYSARALYPITAMMNHSCISNTSHCISLEDYSVRVRTTTDVPRGAELYGSYTHSLLPTILRREHLRESKHFDCACRRCSDPTELGTHMSSLKCNKCDNGIIVPLDSLDSDSTWKCTHCPFTTGSHAIRRVLSIIQAEIDAAEEVTGFADGGDAIQVRETVFRKYRSVLHPQHAFNTMLRYSLSQLYGRCEGYLLDDLPDVVLEHKVDICKMLLRVLDVVEPGYTRVRGMTLYELHAPLLFLAKNLFHTGVIDNAGLKSKMIEAAEILKEAANILTLEFPDTTEGQIGQVALQSLQQLNASIEET